MHRMEKDLEQVQSIEAGKELHEYIKGDLRKLFTDDTAKELMEAVTPARAESSLAVSACARRGRGDEMPLPP